MSFIQTYTGSKWYLEPSKNTEYLLPDIANSLAKLARFNGHSRAFWSVAQHSIILAEQIYKKIGNKRYALAGLLHDGAESVIGDVPTPFRAMFEEAKNIEDIIELQIFKDYGVAEFYKDRTIKQYDLRMLRTEIQQLMEHDMCDQSLIPFDIKLLPQSPSAALSTFYRAFYEYSGLPKDESLGNDLIAKAISNSLHNKRTLLITKKTEEIWDVRQGLYERMCELYHKQIFVHLDNLVVCEERDIPRDSSFYCQMFV